MTDMALRWVVRAHLDKNTCKPCKDNHGKLYRNRQAAYRDYPNGAGYVKCVGAEYGNKCRCRAVKRGQGGDNSMDPTRMEALAARAMFTSPNAWRTAMLSELSADARTLVPEAPTFRVQMASGASSNALYFYDAIGGWDGTRALDVATALRDMTGPVDLHFNSPGGSIFEGAAIFNALRSYGGGPLASYIDGLAASAASFIAMAAHPYDAKAGTGGVRAYDNTMIMVHDGRGIAMGTADDMRDYGDLLDALSDTAAEIYAARAGGKATEWRDTMREGDTWYRAAAAKDAKLVDVVLGAGGAPASAEPQERVSLLSLFSVTPPAAAAPELIAPSIDVAGILNALKGAIL